MVGLLIAAVGCGGGGADGAGGGRAKIAVSGAALTSDVARVTLTISKGDGPDFPALVQDLTHNGDQWTVYMTGIPAGPGRLFSVVAYDGSGTAILSGSAKADIAAGGTATVLITLNPTSGGTLQNQAPVMDYLSASDTLVAPGGVVRLGASAHDPDPADTITYQWAATCGTFDDATKSAVHWTAPAASGSCQLSLSVTDNHGASVAAFIVIEIGVLTGDVLVTVGLSDAPVITAMSIAVRYGTPVTEGTLSVTAADPGGAGLAYTWTSDCGGITFDSSQASGPGATNFTYTGSASACSLTVTVTNPSGGSNQGTIIIPPRPAFNLAPVITNAVQPNADLTRPEHPVVAAPGSAVPLKVFAEDPEGQVLAFAWSASAGTLDAALSVTTSPGSSSVVYHLPDPLPAGTTVTVTVTDPLGEAATHVFHFEASATNPCAGVTCTASDLCHTAGTCDTTTGVCAAGAATVCPTGQTCDPADGACKAPPNLCAAVTCTASDLCHLPGICDASTGVCSAQTAKGCASGQACDPADGTCKASNLCANVTCTATDLCHVAGTCNAATGQCSTQTAVQCSSGQTCDPADGACKATNLCASVTCTASDLCHVAGTCDPTTGQCSTQTAKCPAGVTCDPTSGTCLPTARSPHWAVAKDLQISGPVGLAMDVAGNTYLAGAIFSLSSVDFDGHSVASGGDADIFLAQYNSSGVAQWAVGYGDGALANTQVATGAAVTNDGTLAIIFNFAGSFSIGTGALNSSSPIDGVGFLNTADGSGKTAKQFNDGTNGALKSIAANPNDSTAAHGNRIAVCGLANGGVPALPTTGAVSATGNDIIIAAFKSDGTQLWGRQYSSSGTFNEECDSVAVDDNGDVWAIGSTAGATLNFGGSTSALTGPGNSNRKYLWIAKFDGSTGNALLSAIFTGTGQVTPNGIGGNSIVVDSSGGVYAGGQVVGAVTFGSTTLTSAGGADAWVAKFNATTLTPIWAERMGGTASDNVNGLALDNNGDVIAVGGFNRTTSISGSVASPLSITANGTTAPDVFVWLLEGATGATDFLAGYGDSATQTGDSVAANRSGTQNQITVCGTLNATIPFPAPAGTVTATGSTDVFLLTGQIR